jgi:hypothetical protein
LNLFIELTPFQFIASVSGDVPGGCQVSGQHGTAQLHAEEVNFRHLFALNASSLRTKMRSFSSVSEGDFEAYYGTGFEALKDERFNENCPK